MPIKTQPRRAGQELLRRAPSRLPRPYRRRTSKPLPFHSEVNETLESVGVTASGLEALRRHAEVAAHAGVFAPGRGREAA